MSETGQLDSIIALHIILHSLKIYIKFTVNMSHFKGDFSSCVLQSDSDHGPQLRRH